MKPQMNTDRCSSVLLTRKSMSGGQRYFHREDAKSAKKSDFKNFAFFASSRWIFLVAAGLLCVHRWLHFVRFMQTKILAACEGFLASAPYSKPPYSDEIQDLPLCEAGEPDKQGCCCPLRIGAAQDVCSRAAPGRSAKTQSLIPIDQSAPALPRLHVRNCWRRSSKYTFVALT